MARQRTETIELTEMIVIHGDSLQGSDSEKRAKLTRIMEALRERGIDFVDQPEAFEIWVGTSSRDAVLSVLEELGFRPDLYAL